MPKYVGFAIGGEDHPVWADPKTAEEAMARYGEWDEKLRAQGRMVSGAGLNETARVLRRKEDDVLVSDGPFAEASEVVGGWAMIEAADYDEAVRIFSDHPHLEFGPLEVREVVLE
ncbi:YciI family protein [Amycolatopsis suaedae]|uniref:YCII-related domain-containing protein n=1 Tax=Amycolatopsis suaedae TaxID=2510978 RepID=A0A4Q7JDF9_9PSEU|nr:YciI family protein [Amycolatopsis suaedae]RZQ65102.1 hypothetical protein EWH70_04175 [Amycolatopsis suaedae]